MYLDPNWNILTVGDGDLSFSCSLLKDHGYGHLTASTFDDAETVKTKYHSNEIDSLNNSAIRIFHKLDITDATSIPNELFYKFDLVIFQFPLIPLFKSIQAFQYAQGHSSNLLNRQLIVSFINNSTEHLLAPEGANLCYVTSKDVKPYSDWDLENIGPLANGASFLGLMDFDHLNFPRYKIRNVDRDQQVKGTEAKTYVWGRKHIVPLTNFLNTSPKHLNNHCKLCGKGPFGSANEVEMHENSKTHQRKVKYQTEWLNYLASTSHLK